MRQKQVFFYSLHFVVSEAIHNEENVSTIRIALNLVGKKKISLQTFYHLDSWSAPRDSVVDFRCGWEIGLDYSSVKKKKRKKTLHSQRNLDVEKVFSTVTSALFPKFRLRKRLPQRLKENDGARMLKKSFNSHRIRKVYCSRIFNDINP